MKKLFYILLTLTACYTLTGCSDDEWGNGDPAMEHIYYIGFEDWGKFDNKITFEPAKGTPLAIPVQFHSERVRSYNVTTYYYVASEGLDYGTHYQVVDKDGKLLQPDSNGAFSLQWDKAVKGVQNIYVKSIKSKYVYDESKLDFTGLTEKEKQELIKKEKERINNLNSYRVCTFDPKAGAISHPENITNSKTNDYEVRSFSQNYFRVVFVDKVK